METLICNVFNENLLLVGIDKPVIVYLSCALSFPDLSHDLVHALSAMMHPDPSLRWVVGLHSVVCPHVGGRRTLTGSQSTADWVLIV